MTDQCTATKLAPQIIIHTQTCTVVNLTIGTTGPELMYLTRSRKNGFAANAA